jgi:hypothetical protein
MRKAYGAHRTMSPQVKARNIVEDMRLSQAHGIARTPAHYGPTADVLVLVEELLRKQAA